MSTNRQSLLSKMDIARQRLRTAQEEVAELELLLHDDQLETVNPTQSQESYKHILDHLIEGCQIIGFDWRYLYVNEVTAQQGHQPKDALLGYTMMEKYPGIETTPMFAALRRCMEERITQQLENEFNYPDGSTGWFELSIQPVPEGVFILSLDITKRKRVENSLKLYVQRMEILHQIDLGLIQGGSIQSLVEATLKYLRKLIPCQRATMAIIDPATNEGLIFAVDMEGDTALGKGIRVPVLPGVFEGLDARHTRIFDDFRSLQDSYPQAKQFVKEGLVSAIQAVLMDQGRPVGSLGLLSDTPNFFTADHQEIVAEIASQLAIAVHQMHLAEELEQHVALLEQRVVERTTEIQMAKERAEAILNYSADGMLLVHSNFAIQKTNAAFNTLFSCNVDDYFNQPLTALLDAADVPHVISKIQEGIAAERVVNTEVRAQRRNGTVFDAEFSIGHIKNDGFVCSIRDITERKTYERELRFHASLQENVSDAVIVTDPGFSIRSWNRAAERIYGWRAEEVIGRSTAKILRTQFVSPSDRERNIHQLHEQGWWQGEIVQHHKDGSTRHILGSVTLVKDDRGIPFGIVSVNRDISERNKAEAALRESEARYRLLAENVSDMISKIDMNGVRTFVTPSCRNLLGYTPDELIGRPSYEIAHPDDISQTQAVIAQAIESKYSTFSLTQRIRHKDSHYVWVEVTGNIIRNSETGEPIETIRIIRDITERKRAEEALSLRLKEENEFQGYLKALHEITIELTQIDELDRFYKRTIESGRERFGFERLALFLYDEKDRVVLGTYGTDSKGKLADERLVRFSPNPKGILLRAFERAERFYVDNDVVLHDSLKPIGFGWNAAAVLWNGTQGLGWLVADNLLSQTPASKPLLDILGLYALTIGTLLAQKRTQVDLQASEKQLRQSEAKFSTAFRASPAAISIARVSDGRWIEINEALAKMTGYSSEELIGHTSTELGLVDATARAKILEAIQQQGFVRDVEIQLHTKSNQMIDVLVSSEQIELNGQVCALSIQYDITRRKKAEAALRESEERFRFLVDGVRDYAIYILDARGNIASWNVGAEHLKGYQSNEIIGRHFSAFFTPEARQNGRPEQLLATAALQGRTEDDGWRVRKDGSRFWANVVVTALRNADGAVSGFAKITRDMTLHKQAEEDLRQALAKEKELGELKSRFVSTASHEFRTPLATILALTETLKAYRHKFSDEQIDQRLVKIQAQIGHLKDIMDDVLLLARMQAQRVEFNPVKLNLDSLCRSVVDEFQSRPDVAQKFLYTCDEQLYEVVLDKKLMRQIINNLVSNAVKYSPGDKTVTLNLTYENENLIFKVRDEGIGIPEADLKHLFEPFHRASNVGAVSGTGLGMVITKESVELHGGNITVDSQIGVGTTFTVSIPLRAKDTNNNDKNPSY
jgi:PAS domain S-box-containing protein